MSNTSLQDKPFVPESQKERWVKYGVNVVVTVVAVVLLAAAVTYLAQRFDKRIDTTAAGVYSLKPQTVNVIKDNKQKIKLVGLYAARTATDQDNPYYGPVQDLLEEYARKGKNVDFEMIDPVKQPTKTDALVNEAIAKYGGAVKAYKDYITDFQKTYDQLRQLTSAEAAQVADVQTDSLGNDEKSQNAAAIISTVKEAIPTSLSRLKDRTDRAMKAKYPQYKDIVDSIKDGLDSISKTEAAIVKYSATLKDDASLPPAIRSYLSQSPPRHEAIQKLADKAAKKVDTLGELKVGELQQAIKGQDLILVLGDNDWRVINPEQVWVTDTRDIRGFAEGQQIKPRFAGEQAVTTAILSITSGNKPKVAFIRAGGPPLTTPGFPPFQQGGPLSEVADRLRDYNFDVLEKDVTGMWAMQAQAQGQQAEPEPSDEQIKDAVWIVLDLPSQGPGAPPSALGPKLAEHLKEGGSAMVLGMPQSDSLSEVLKDYGIQMVTDAAIVHEVPSADRPRSSDWSEEVQGVPIVFVINKYGDHLLTSPLNSLDSLLAWAIPVRTIPAPGAKTTPLLPVTNGYKIWGERNIDSVQNGTPTYDTTGPNADLPGPFNAGAVSEKGKARLVVFGGLQSFTNQIVSWPDADMLKRGVVVSRFPGNAELFCDAVFWLAHMEPMIAISPAAMQVSRIREMSDTSLAAWRVGVLIILLPGLILAAGIGMYFARRD